MAEFIPLSQAEPSPADAVVHLEVRQGDGPTALFTLDGDNILIGAVPGCDVRLTQAELPPLLCLLTHEPGGLRLRQLALTTGIEVNGKQGGDRLLASGDTLSFSGCTAGLRFTPRPFSSALPAAADDPEAAAARRHMLEDGLRQLAAAQRQLAEDRRDWEQDAEKQAEELASKSRKVLEDAEVLVKERAALQKNGTAIPAAAEPAVQQLRAQLESYRDELYERYQKRRDHLHALQESVNRAARNVQEEKRVLEAFAQQVRQEADTQAEHEANLTARAAELEQARTSLVEQHRLVEDWQREVEREYATRLAEVEAVEKRQARERERLAGVHAQYQGDLARLDRGQVELEERERLCTARAKQVDEQTVALKDLADVLQTQARELAELDARQQSQAESLTTREADLAQRAALLETQQTTLVALRGRIERLQADLTQREGQLTEQRLRQDRLEGMLHDYQRRLKEQTTTLHQQQEAWNAERKQMEGRCATLEAQAAAVQQKEREVEELRARMESRRIIVEATQNEQAEAAELLGMRAERLQRIRKQLHEERDALRAREQQLAQETQAADALRKELRQQAGVLAEREKQTVEGQRETEEVARTWQERRTQLDAVIAAADKENLGKRAELIRLEGELAERDLTLKSQLGQLHRDLAALELEHQSARLERQEADTRCREAVTERERLQIEFGGLQARLPDLIQQAQAAVERSGKAREQLREHLRESHEYTQQCRGEFQASHRDLFAESEQLRQQQSILARAQDDHRHAVSSFRQYLSEWQGQLAWNRRAATAGDPGPAVAGVCDPGQSAAAPASQRPAPGLEPGPDLPRWCRQRLRELVERRLLQTGPGSGLLPSVELAGPIVAPPAILPFREAVSAEDQKLADQLVDAGLIDQPTLAVLLEEGRKRRCRLHDVFVDDDCLTGYQLEQIEAGRLDALAVGPLHVLDRLRQTPLDSVYRVLDSRTGDEALLRRLSEAAPAERKDGFQRSFKQAATVQHPNLAATREVLDWSGSPAVLQELVVGVPSGEWSEAAAVPGVWRRLMHQAAAGLRAAHAAGLTHGHLHAGRLLLTESGELKICGLGEPSWLRADRVADSPGTHASSGPHLDLHALGRIAKAWLGSASKSPRSSHEALHVILDRLLSDDAARRFPSAQALLEHLDRIEIADDAAAWERFLAGIRRQLSGETLEERKSA